MDAGPPKKTNFSRAWLLFTALFLSAPLAYAKPASPLRPVPGGAFELFWVTETSKGDSGRPTVPVAPFSAQEHAVTNAEFRAFLKDHPEWRKSRVSPLFAEAGYLSQFRGDLRLRPSVRPGAPATYVSWFAARAYCESRGLRLPSTYEWELMASASEASPHGGKNPAFLGRILEWYGRPKQGELPEVKSVYRNFYGLYDLHGLVWEWVEDFNAASVTGESREDAALNRDLFCGAGSLNGGDKENYAAFMRYAFRSSLKGKVALWNLGFRCVR